MTTKDCLLIIPPFQSGPGSILKSFKYSMPPLGLLSIAAWLRQNDISVSLLDFTIEDTTKYSTEDILLNYAKENGTPRWIGISVCTPVAYNAYNLADICKKLFTNTKVVLGGPHITVLGSDVFKECNSADFLITGEGEYTLCNLIKDNNFSANNILIRADNANRTLLPDNTVDLATLPMPAYDLLKFNKYIPPPASLNSKHPGIGIITTRGCPFSCTFCTKISGSKLRLIPVPKVIEQLKYLKEKFNIKQFHFYDDTISCNRKYIIELCETIIRENLNIHWSGFARVDTVDEEILMKMKKAGCFIIMYGVESMDEEILLSIKKGITVPQIKTALNLTRKVGIESRISVIIGNPKDTPETLQKTQKELLKLKTDFLQVFIAIPMPGSQFYKEAKAENRVLSENWENYNLSKVLYKHPVFTEKQLFKIQRQYYLAFYLRFGIILRYLSKIRSFNAVRNIFNGFLGFLKIISA